jgi:hypothetical protein
VDFPTQFSVRLSWTYGRASKLLITFHTADKYRRECSSGCNLHSVGGLFESGGKVELSLCLTIKALRHEGVWKSGCIDQRLLDLGTSWRWVVSLTPPPFTLGEKACGTRWVGPRAGLDAVEKKKVLNLLGLERRPFYRTARSQPLYRFSYPVVPLVLARTCSSLSNRPTDCPSSHRVSHKEWETGKAVNPEQCSFRRDNSEDIGTFAVTCMSSNQN